MHTKHMYMYYSYIYTYIKTHDSELRGQEEAGYTQQISELFTCKIIITRQWRKRHYQS